MTLTDPLFHEVFDQWRAWQVLVENVTTNQDPRTVDPLKVNAELEGLDNESWNRLAHLLIGHACANSVSEAVVLLRELRGYAGVGRRPRFGVEAGLSFEDFEEMRP